MGSQKDRAGSRPTQPIGQLTLPRTTWRQRPPVKPRLDPSRLRRCAIRSTTAPSAVVRQEDVKRRHHRSGQGEWWWSRRLRTCRQAADTSAQASQLPRERLPCESELLYPSPTLGRSAIGPGRRGGERPDECWGFGGRSRPSGNSRRFARVCTGGPLKGPGIRVCKLAQRRSAASRSRRPSPVRSQTSVGTRPTFSPEMLPIAAGRHDWLVRPLEAWATRRRVKSGRRRLNAGGLECGWAAFPERPQSCLTAHHCERDEAHGPPPIRTCRKRHATMP
jgi:hypothetical protein